MEIVGIFAVVEGALYSVQFDDKGMDEFRHLFTSWQDPEYLEQFFEEHKRALDQSIYAPLTVEQAVITTLDEAAQFERRILAAARRSGPDLDLMLEGFVFKPLHKSVHSNEHLQSKAYGTRRKSWLRVYAIRLDTNVYFITGGGIKLTKAMTTPHLQTELVKLGKAQDYLRENNIIDKGDLELLEIEYHD